MLAHRRSAPAPPDGSGAERGHGAADRISAVRLAGGIFGGGRGILLIAVALIGVEFAGVSRADQLERSNFVPFFEPVVEWIKVMAPQGFEILVPEQDMI